jgi:lipopolysaccharide/colanic/teichoic acid biosynthesis glycosyltransferase
MPDYWLASDSATSAPTKHSAAEMFSPWCRSLRKRWFDFACGSLALIASAPVMLGIAVLIRFTSHGPILFRQKRIGRDGREIEVLKFRTMVHRPSQNGPGVTRAGDQRITPVGRFLRKWKLDELPQFINVVRGEMSLVGPRPDLAKYWQALPEYQPILALTPGITSRATLAFVREEELLAQVPETELEEFYCRTVLPRKIQLEMEYARSATLISDVCVLIQTSMAMRRQLQAGFQHPARRKQH